MERVLAYTRPVTIEEALEAMSRPHAVAIGGGTSFNGSVLGRCEPLPCEIVDLQALSLSFIERTGEGGIDVGATATLQQVAGSPDLPAVVREAARRERPSTLRNQATLGGLVARGEFDSELLAALLAHDAVVTIASSGLPPGPVRYTLADVLGSMLPLAGANLVTAVHLDGRGQSAAARTGRTVADRPIVAAVARKAHDGTTRLALAGVAERPTLVSGVSQLAELRPPHDFRGSSQYRSALASVLASRAMNEVA